MVPLLPTTRAKKAKVLSYLSNTLLLSQFGLAERGERPAVEKMRGIPANQAELGTEEEARAAWVEHWALQVK